jgi:hypothetical protein
MWKRGKFFAFIAIFQVAFLILFAAFGEYDEIAMPTAWKNVSHEGQEKVTHLYASKIKSPDCV